VPASNFNNTVADGNYFSQQDQRVNGVQNVSK